MSNAYWLIQGYQSLTLIFEQKVEARHLTSEHMESLLKALVAKAGLTYDEIVGRLRQEASPIANDHLAVRRTPSRILRVAQIHTLLPGCGGKCNARCLCPIRDVRTCFQIAETFKTEVSNVRGPMFIGFRTCCKKLPFMKHGGQKSNVTSSYWCLFEYRVMIAA
jgi:hypothetical protein